MGGRHHAKKDEAAGFCYVNDIVLAILSLMGSFSKVLYIDIDIHHGDGVEEAFYYTDKVFCVSFHHYAPGFYPGTGRITQVGAGKGKYYTVNVPLKAGIGDAAYVELFTQVVSGIVTRYSPQAVVLQCGVDGLVGDPLGGFNLTLRGLGECVRTVRDLCRGRADVPLLVLGGGGYNSTNAARAFTYFTSLLLDKELPNDIPEHRFFEDYKDHGFQLHLPAGHEPDKNDQAYLDQVRQTVQDNLAHIASAP